MSKKDTIVALSTPPGRSGIGVIRLNGEHALEHVRALVRDEQFSPEPNRVTLRKIYDPQTHELLDRALITYFKSPHSFTGEDIVELSCHGSPVLLLHIVDTLLALGARAADAGEFTLRALSNGRLNLSQAEAVRDLIDAQTEAAVRQAARQLGGELSARLQPTKDALLEIIVPLESSLEFVEDDLPQLTLERISLQLENLIQSLDTLADTFRSGRLLKDGLKVALVGRPNVGKSSVFNRLLASDRAIVTEIPGTTRDSLSELLNIDGVPVLLTDTAGMRESNDPVEYLGIERTRRAIADADLVLFVLDGSQPLTGEDEAIFANIAEDTLVIALNKSDLGGFNNLISNGIGDNSKRVAISAKTGAGLDALRDAIMEPFKSGSATETEFLITNARHFDLLRRSADALRSSKVLVERRASEDLILVGLYESLRYLGQITGETTPEDVLSQIFATFCIGK
ncbi:MAG TPA: tRNA uridine-5-carboxymethylaminomethyl(34) synthesis GTPase MnmE [Pyrinomonadaceae bacterium]|nr:tRNA uridine-5-carboxymethylaminomethyl(34) synthesis GTPase MnmE [Pyrinomonadaceae bacterium]